MDIKITYRNGTEFSDDEKVFINKTSKSFGQVTINTYSFRAGVIDLVSILEITLTYFLLTNLKAFVKGFIGEDWFKSLGQKARIEIGNELKATKYFIKAYYDCFVRNKSNIQEAHVISEQIGNINFFVVLNHFHINDELINKLPKAFVDTYGKISLGHFEIESKICQLFPDFDENEWRYLFTPSNMGFGKFVDRYYDFKTNRQILINTREEFIKRFGLVNEDKYKLIISGLIER